MKSQRHSSLWPVGRGAGVALKTLESEHQDSRAVSGYDITDPTFLGLK